MLPAISADKNIRKEHLPLAVYVLSLGIFTIVTSEFQVAGMIQVMAADLGASISKIGYLVSVYAFPMALGGRSLRSVYSRPLLKQSL